jgi:methylenetetrahydrofolate reductase (NADPH)
LEGLNASSVRAERQLEVAPARPFVELVGQGRTTLSYEFFPPRDHAARERVHDIVSRIRPDFATVTYGAGGTTRDRTFDMAFEINARVPCAHHLTILRHTREELRNIIARIREAGMRNIIAIRGDPPKGQAEFPLTAGGFRHADELVALIKETAPEVTVIVAGYPEVHQEALSARHDLQMLKRKQDAGADLIFTQLFYDNEFFFRWRDRCAAAGIELPIIPGLMAVSSPRQLRKIAELSGASLPAELMGELDRFRDDEEARARAGAEWCSRQALDLLEHGVPGIHLYCLNRSHPAIEVGLAVRAWAGR